MQNDQSVLEVFDAIARRRRARRDFLRVAGSGAAAFGGLALLDACGHDGSTTTTVTPTPTATTAAVTDVDILSFALNLEYLEAQYYSYAATGAGLSSSLLGGTGTAGAVSTSGANPPRAVNFTTEVVIGQYAREIAADELTHVAFLRTALGSSAPAQPAINISGDAAGSFTAVARAAGVVGSSAIFDPYSSPDFFLLGAFLFEDVGVTAYKGGSPLISNKTYLEAAAGILAAEAYHAGLIRTTLYARGQSNATLITAAGQISDLRDVVDGNMDDNSVIGVGADDDQGIAAVGSGATIRSNLVPVNANGLAYSRTIGNVHNIVYGTAKQVTGGGFFPNGTNIPTNTALQKSNVNG